MSRRSRVSFGLGIAPGHRATGHRPMPWRRGFPWLLLAGLVPGACAPGVDRQEGLGESEPVGLANPPAPAKSPSSAEPARAADPAGEAEPATEAPPRTAAERQFAEQRRRMVERQLKGRDITDGRVLAAMTRVPRHRLVPEAYRELAYADTPLPIGEGQTISQPYIVALMTQLARTTADARALDVGTGSGYQAAVLAELCKTVYSIEIVESLANRGRERLAQLGYRNVQVRHGDGYAGWQEHAPFDLIILAAAPDHVPQPLTEQLAVGGRLVLPVGRNDQTLDVIEKQADGSLKQWTVTLVRFVPMTGEAEKK